MLDHNIGHSSFFSRVKDVTFSVSTIWIFQQLKIRSHICLRLNYDWSTDGFTDARTTFNLGRDETIRSIHTRTWCRTIYPALSQTERSSKRWSQMGRWGTNEHTKRIIIESTGLVFLGGIHYDSIRSRKKEGSSGTQGSWTLAHLDGTRESKSRVIWLLQSIGNKAFCHNLLLCSDCAALWRPEYAVSRTTAPNYLFYGNGECSRITWLKVHPANPMDIYPFTLIWLRRTCVYGNCSKRDSLEENIPWYYSDESKAKIC